MTFCAASLSVITMVLDCTASPNVAVIGAVVITFVAPFVGEEDVTVGGVLSTVAVVKDQVVEPVIVLPAVSLAPVTVAVYVVKPLRGLVGVKVAVWVVSL